MKQAILKDWTLRADSGPYLTGYVYGHDEFANGTYIKTEQIYRYDPELFWAETDTTRYSLRHDFIEKPKKTRKPKENLTEPQAQ